MKRKLLLVFGLSLFILISCGSTDNVFDEDLPAEKTAMLLIAPAFTVKTYNGIAVNLKTSMGMTGFRIPPGNTTLVMDMDSGRSFGNVRYYAKNFSLTYNFLEGNEYRMMLGFLDKEGNYKASNIGETYIGLILYQGKDYKKPLLTMRFS